VIHKKGSPTTNAKERLLDAYKSFYYSELDRREKLSGRATVLFTIFTIELGSVGYYLQNWLGLPDTPLSWVTAFNLLLVAQIIVMGYAAHTIYGFIYAHSFYSISPTDTDDYANFRGRYSSSSQGTQYMRSESAIMSRLMLTYRTLGEQNRVQNDSKEEDYNKALKRLMLALGFAIGCGIIYTYCQGRYPPIRSRQAV